MHRTPLHGGSSVVPGLEQATLRWTRVREPSSLTLREKSQNGSKSLPTALRSLGKDSPLCAFSIREDRDFIENYRFSDTFSADHNDLLALTH
ncbi:hypothetical protein TNCV_398391 [Trichonephila clavipes]|nr:hypothetical protein TNCV_398391 [Trichonephila clavipes]